MNCPKCRSGFIQRKDGFTNAGSQRYRCKACGARYTPGKKPGGYSQDVRDTAVRMYNEGLSFRQIGRLLQVSHASVMNWVKEQAGAGQSDP